ncbi:hypothetical protein SLA2020_233250 [Shorea laevis]
MARERPQTIFTLKTQVDLFPSTLKTHPLVRSAADRQILLSMKTHPFVQIRSGSTDSAFYGGVLALRRIL